MPPQNELTGDKDKYSKHNTPTFCNISHRQTPQINKIDHPGRRTTHHFLLFIHTGKYAFD